MRLPLKTPPALLPEGARGRIVVEGSPIVELVASGWLAPEHCVAARRLS